MELRSECDVTEERIVDLLLAGAGDKTATAGLAALRRHAEGCRECAERLREWQGLLDGGAEGTAEVPPAGVRRRLFAAVRRRAALRTIAGAIRGHVLLRRFGAARQSLRGGRSLQPRRRNRALTLGSAAVVAAALLCFGALCAIYERIDSPVTTGFSTLAKVKADDEILSHMGMVVQARTVQYPVQSRGNERAHGVAWVNDDSEELLLLVEGLPPLPGQGYRVWSVREDSRSPLGMLQLAAGRAQLHYRGGELHGADAISVSREPIDATAADGTAQRTLQITVQGTREVAAVSLK